MICVLHIGEENSTGKIKLFKEHFSKWEKVQEAICVRKETSKSKSKYDQLFNQLGRSFQNNHGYHSACYKNFTAVSKKGQKTPTQSSSSVTKRSDVSSPKNPRCSNVLPEVCIFCDKKRKKVKGKWENLTKCAAFQSESKIRIAAVQLEDEALLLKIGNALNSEGSDFISKEVHYHHECKINYLKKVKVNKNDTKEMEPKKKAFKAIVKYINEEVLNKNDVEYLSTLFDLYKRTFIIEGGSPENIKAYTVQHFGEKIQRHYQHELSVKAEMGKKKIIWKTSSMSINQAYQYIENKPVPEKLLIWKCASLLRHEILALESKELQEPLNVEDILKGEVQPPDLLKSFFQVLYAGETGNISMRKERLVDSSAADAVYSCSGGKLLPGKHIALGCAVKSKTGSRGMVSLLNRFGHTISNETVRRIDMMLENTVMSEENITPKEIKKQANLCTGTAWDNFDVNLETLSGANTIHHTYGICYQNVLPDDSSHSNQSVLELKESTSHIGRKRKISVVTQNLYNTEEVQPYWKKPKMSQFPYVKTIVFGPESLHKYCDYDTLWMIAFNKNDKIPMWTGWNTSKVKEENLQRVGYMKHIQLPPTRADVIRETLVRSQTVAAECGQEDALVTYDLAIAKIAKQIQCESTPQFDNVFIMFGSFHIEQNIFSLLGKFIEGSGGPFILAEGNVVAMGSMNRFLKGKMYNRCRRSHMLLSTALHGLHLEAFIKSFNIKEELLQKIIKWAESQDEDELDREMKHVLAQYETYVSDTRDGEQGKTAQF